MWFYSVLVAPLFISSSYLFLNTGAFTPIYRVPIRNTKNDLSNTDSDSNNRLRYQNVALSAAGVPEIDEWIVIDSGAIVGVIKNHPYIGDGDTITTSPLADGTDFSENSVVFTESGSKYKLNKAAPAMKNFLNNNAKKDSGSSSPFPQFSVKSESKSTPNSSSAFDPFRSFSRSIPQNFLGQLFEKTRMPVINDWKIAPNGSILGFVKNHPTIPNGDFITTSPIAQTEDLDGETVAVTSSGSKYLLGKASTADMKEELETFIGKNGSGSQEEQREEIPLEILRSMALEDYNLSGKSIGGGKWLLSGEPFRSTSGKSQIWNAYESDPRGFPVHGPYREDEKNIKVKITKNKQALKRENDNYNRVTNIFIPGSCFVKKIDFYPNIDGGGLEGHSALVMEGGVRDLKSLLLSRDLNGLNGRALRDAAWTAGKVLETMHGAGLVWTDLKAENFVLLDDSNGDSGLQSLKAIDLESAMPIGRHPVDYSPESCPPEFADAFVKGEAGDFVLDPSYDMWSLGMLLYELATGKSYFSGHSPLTITKILQSEGFRVDVSSVEDPKLRSLIRQLLNPEPYLRPRISTYLSHPFFSMSGIGGFSFGFGFP